MTEQVKKALLEFQGFWGGEIRSQEPMKCMDCLIDLGYVEMNDTLSDVSTIYVLTELGWDAYRKILSVEDETVKLDDIF